MAIDPPGPASLSKPSYEKGKEFARQIFTEVLRTIEVERAMKQKIVRRGNALHLGEDRFPLTKSPHIVAFGKAANRMAAAMVEILGGKTASGVVVSTGEPAMKVDGFRYFQGGHPYPTAGSFAGADAALELARNLEADDTVVFLISGGGSAMLEKPCFPGISLDDMANLNRVLVGAGVPIEEMNVIRKHLSAVKGGRLGQEAYPAAQLTIYISDVPEQFPSMVASGPTLPDESTLEKCYELLERHKLTAKLPEAIRSVIEARSLQETPKAGDERLGKSKHFCLLSNRDAVQAALNAARTFGFRAEIDTGDWDSDYRKVGDGVAARLEKLVSRYPGVPVCLVLGGEVTCPVTGPGSGGRNQAFVLNLVSRIAGRRRVVLSAGTDGTDGNSPAAGALADGDTLGRAEALGLDAEKLFQASDSYHFFAPLGDALETGPTDNNVRDLRLLMAF